ncbi:unnamed protein product, partial [Coregonus sp. 'balchen']
MAVSIRGRPIRSLRMRGRNDSGEENVPLDLTREPSDNLREILQNVAKPHGVTNMRKLGHLNNFIKLLISIGHCEEKFGFTYEEIIICLRLALLNEAKEVRAAGLRVLRYLIRDSNVLQKVLRLQVDYLIARCIDIQQSNEGERTQALRLVRKERDRMVRAAIAIVCELALKNPEVVANRGGLSTILKSVIDCQLSRINEALITTILHLLNHPHTRQYVRNDVELEQILAPFTDFHYRHNADTSESLLKEDREARFLSSRMAIVAAFRSWSGIINLCRAGNSGIQSLIGLLCIPNVEVRKGLMEVFYEIFRLPLPIVTQDFTEALLSVDPSRCQDSWRLSDGFVAAEAKVLLPHRARSRPDLMDNYLALVLSAFISSGLLEGLVEVVTSSEDQISVRATILLGELLHMANTILPHSHKEALMLNLRDSQILNHKQNLDWNWLLIATILKWPNVNLRNNKDEQMHKFVRRLLYFYKPSSKLYAGLELDHPKARQLTVVGCQFIEFLIESDEDGQAYLEELVKDMVAWLSLSSGLKPDRCLQSNGLLTTLSQHYFLFLGTLSAHPHGVKMLEKCSLFQSLLNLCSVKNQDAVLKLAVSTLDYSRDGLARVILSKILTAATDTCRLYATKHLCVLLRAGVEFFSNWGMELLVTQLHDHSKAVSMEALDILDEACEDKANLHALIQLKPALTHLGDKGLLLLLRFLSIPKGFSYLNERGYVSKQLDRWQKEYNLKYVDLIEEQLNEALTTYRKPVDGDNYRPNVYLPVHLYGQLVHDKTGCHLLEAQSVVPDLSYTVRSPMLDTWEGIKQLKAALWALGNIGSSNWGLNLLQEENIIPDILALAQHCEVLSIRGTCLYVVGVISKTRQGCEVLKQYGWDAVRHSRRTLWPVTPDEVDKPMTSELSSVPSTLSLNSEFTSSRHNSESEAQPNMYILDDDKSEMLDQSDDASLYLRSKPVKDRSPFTILASTRFVRNRFLNSLSLPSKKLRSTSDPKSMGGSRTPTELKLGGMRRNRTVTEPSFYSSFNGRSIPKSPTVSLETSFVGIRGSVGGSEEQLGEGRLARAGREGAGLGLGGSGEPPSREQSSREHLAGGDGGSSSSGGGGGGGTQFKSRSQSFNTDTTTSGISSMSSSPSRETVGNPEHPEPDSSDCVSLNTVVSAKMVKTLYSLAPTQAHTNHLPLSKSNSVSLVPPGSSHTLPRRAQSLKSPSVAAIKSLADCSFMYTSPRDALGYATLKRLQQQRIHPSLSHSESLASPAKDVLFTDTITMKTGSLDSRLTPRSSAWAPEGFFPTAQSWSVDREKQTEVEYLRLSAKRVSCSVPHISDAHRRPSRAYVSRLSAKRVSCPAVQPLRRMSISMPCYVCILLSLPSVPLTLLSPLSLTRLPPPGRFLKALSFASLDKEDLLSPINQITLQRCSSVRSMISSATYGCNDDYVGLALPMDINDMFHIRDTPYFQQTTSPPADEKCPFYFGESDSDSGRPYPIPLLKQQFSISELMASRENNQNHILGPEETGLQEHTDDNCLYCVGATVLGYHTQPQINNAHTRTDYIDFPWSSQTSHRLEVMPQSKFSGVSGCSDTAVSQGSVCSTPTAADIVLGIHAHTHTLQSQEAVCSTRTDCICTPLNSIIQIKMFDWSGCVSSLIGCCICPSGGKAISEDGPACRVLLRKEVLRLVINLSSSSNIVKTWRDGENGGASLKERRGDPLLKLKMEGAW